MQVNMIRNRTQKMQNSGRLRHFECLESRQLLALTVTTLPATDITLNSARIGAEIVDNGGFNPELAIYWGDEDGGTESRNWDHSVNLKTSPVGQYRTDLAESAIRAVTNPDTHGSSFVRGSVEITPGGE